MVTRKQLCFNPSSSLCVAFRTLDIRIYRSTLELLWFDYKQLLHKQEYLHLENQEGNLVLITCLNKQLTMSSIEYNLIGAIHKGRPADPGGGGICGIRTFNS